MAKNGMTLKGLQELEKTLLQLNIDVSTKMAEKALMSGGTPIVKDAKANIVDAGLVEQGDLLKSIKRRSLFKKGISLVQVGAIGKGGWKAHFHEYGTEPHDLNKGSKTGKAHSSVEITKSAKQHPGNRATHFLTKAMEKNKKEFINRVSKSFTRQFKRYRKK